jgi:hypothetical protein
MRTNHCLPSKAGRDEALSPSGGWRLAATTSLENVCRYSICIQRTHTDEILFCGHPFCILDTTLIIRWKGLLGRCNGRRGGGPRDKAVEGSCKTKPA